MTDRGSLAQAMGTVTSRASRFVGPWLASTCLALAALSSACGGKTIETDNPETPFLPVERVPPGVTAPPVVTQPSGPALPTSPFTARVAKTDVSILYPLPKTGELDSLLGASE
jgi:hypothetical protein